MSNSNIVVINSQPPASSGGSSVMYVVFTTTGSSGTAPTNMTWAQINMADSSANSQIFTYDSNSPITPTSNNSVSAAANSTGITYAYIWINRGDPSASGNTTTTSDVVTAFKSDATMNTIGSTSTSNTALNAPIIQFNGDTSTSDRSYWVYNRSPLIVRNSSSSTLQLQTMANNSNSISGRNSNGICPSSLGFPSSSTGSNTKSAVQSVSTNNTARILSAFPTTSHTTISIWQGGNNSANTIPDYALVFRPIDLSASQDCNGSRQVTLLAQWSQNNSTLTITDAPDDDMSGNLPSGSSCLINSDCASGICSNGTCTNSGSSDGGDGNGGLPWWGWLWIILGIIIVIALIIAVIYRYSKGDNSDKSNSSSYGSKSSLYESNSSPYESNSSRYGSE